MDDIEKRLGKLGIAIPEILLPNATAPEKWAVIACDQFTQDRNYWSKVKEAAADAPSTLHLIFPEIYLDDADNVMRIDNIHNAMRNCIDSGIFAKPRKGFIYLERDTPVNICRRGLVAAIDLECYDWQPSARPLIRATEGTVPERIPPRMDIRRGAPLETPHILLLIDDEDDALLRQLGERAQKSNPVYQGKLMLNSGSIKGWGLDSPEDWAFIAEGLEKLLHSGCNIHSGDTPFLFAAGDGNHSLACAKSIWEEFKAANNVTDHACRYALVEIENIHDPAIQFEPIHRIAFGLNFNEALTLFSALPCFSYREIQNSKELLTLIAEETGQIRFGIVSENRYALIELGPGSKPEGFTGDRQCNIAVAFVQPVLDKAGISLDYIHGEEELFRITAKPGPEKPSCGILMPPVQKTGFFRSIAQGGPLPRKSFSMGKAEEKRFYYECRRLF